MDLRAKSNNKQSDKMKRYIETTPEQTDFLAKAFSVSQRKVRGALRYEEQYENATSVKIRRLAVKRGAKVKYIVDGEDAFYDSDGNWIQNFDNGATIAISKATGNAVLVDKKGEIRAEVEKIQIPDIPALQKAAREL